MIVIIQVIIAFLLGIIFVQWIIPFGDGLLNLFLTKIEVLKGHMAVEITDCQKQASDIKSGFQNTKTSAIGFSVAEEEEDDYEYE